jgi:dTDP-4-dehydrorhamnose 3,5-epimerase
LLGGPDEEGMVMIPGVLIKDLKVIPDERGRLQVILRNDEPCFTQFGQVYITTVYPGVVKGWHSHRKQTDYICCIAGMIKLVLCKMEPCKAVDSIGPETSVFYQGIEMKAVPRTIKADIQELFIGVHNPKLIVIPPGILHGWKCISDHEATVLCVTSEPYDNMDPDEQRVDPHENNIPYQWERKDG